MQSSDEPRYVDHSAERRPRTTTERVLEKSLTVLKPGGHAIGLTGRQDPGFAKRLGAPKFIGVVMGLLSRKVRKQGVSYSFLFMQANGAQLRQLASLDDAGHLRPLIDKTFQSNQTPEALAYVEHGRANGKVVITLGRQRRLPPDARMGPIAAANGRQSQTPVLDDARARRSDTRRRSHAHALRSSLST